jgi:endonuclease/exonuclease/phosphatase family metal-dependent hydrolase
LTEAGLPHADCGEVGLPGPRRLAVMVAARWPVRPLPPPAGMEPPWPEKARSVTVETPEGELDVHAIHVPNARNGWVKVDHLRELARVIAAPGERPRIACGDLNTPRREPPGAPIVTFARDRYGRLRPERGEPWDTAEAAVLDGSTGMRDAWRAVHGPDARELSWAYPTWPRSGYRLDHLLASGDVEVLACDYVHELRLERMSDHSALVANLELPARHDRRHDEQRTAAVEEQ